MGIGKTLVSSSMIDRVAKGLGRPMLEVPVGFKWFVDGLMDGTLGFVGEESAGATFLRRNGKVWTTDKDGLILGLLAAEMTATTGKDPGLLYSELTAKYGDPVYQRIDAKATKEQKAKLGKLSASEVTAKTLAGEPITGVLTEAPGNHAAIGGLKVTTADGWFAARPSGTEDVYKIYAESFKGAEQLKRFRQRRRRWWMGRSGRRSVRRRGGLVLRGVWLGVLALVRVGVCAGADGGGADTDDRGAVDAGGGSSAGAAS